MTAPQEFQAVVLAAGKGSRMPELTTDKPKCLLPIGSKPLVWYPLNKLQQIGFKDVILIVQHSKKSEIQETLSRTGLTLKIDYVTVQDAEENGTADSLRTISEKVTSDLIILSCDLITNFNFIEVINEFRKHEAALCSVFFPMNNETVVVPGPKDKHKPEKDLIGIDVKTNRLVFVASASDFEGDVSISRNLFKKHTNIKMHSNLLDSHIYILKHWVFKYLCAKTSIATFKGEFLPYFLKKQLATRRNDESITEDDIFQYMNDDLIWYNNIKEANSYSDHKGDLKSSYHGDMIKCYAHISSNFGFRINTLPAFWSINAKISELWESLVPHMPLQKQLSEADVKSNQVENCFIWDSAKLNEKTSFRNSVIGSKTEVKSFTRVFNSIVMNDVFIGEKVAIENCIICDKVVINSGSKLKNCIVGNKHEIEAESEHVSEVMTNADKLMEF